MTWGRAKRFGHMRRGKTHVEDKAHNGAGNSISSRAGGSVAAREYLPNTQTKATSNLQLWFLNPRL